MAVINTNVKALFSQAALKSNERSQTVAMQQLSTGKRINSARDDAAGMAIATRMTQRFREVLSPDLVEAARERGLTVHQALTLASIVDHETAAAAEKALVAGQQALGARTLRALALRARALRGTRRSHRWLGALVPADIP